MAEAAKAEIPYEGSTRVYIAFWGDGPFLLVVQEAATATIDSFRCCTNSPLT